MEIKRNPTRTVKIGSISIGGGHPIAVQSMTATHTQDIDATVELVNLLDGAGAGVVRIAVDNNKDAVALAEIRRQTQATISVDLQENYRLAERVAPHVDKIRYNPGHLYHHERQRPWQEKVSYIAQVAVEHDCAIRVGVNCGSVDPEKKEQFAGDDPMLPMLHSAWDHCEYLDSIGFTRYCVSLKDSDPRQVIDVNQRFSARRPDVPLHLGVTEAGMPPSGVIKTRIAFEKLMLQGIGDTIRVSLTVPNELKPLEIESGKMIVDDVYRGVLQGDEGLSILDGLNIISCPSCSRVENEAFVELAEQVKAETEYAKDHNISIAVMGCRVNGPGETDDADLGLWCGPNFVNLKRGTEQIGMFPYDTILGELRRELDRIIDLKSSATP